MIRETFPVPSSYGNQRIGHISDLHIEDEATFCVFDGLVDYLTGENLDCLVVSGDLVEHPDDEPWLKRIHERLDASGVPYVAVSGNHDVLIPGEDAVFRRYFGPLPRVERLAGLTLILFDSFGALPVSARGPEERELFEERGHYGAGQVGQTQFDWLADQLRPEDRVRLAVVHHHLQPEPDARAKPLLDAAEFLDWCGSHAVEFAFVGHLHRTRPPQLLDRTTRLRIGKSIRAPFPVGILDLGAATYTIVTAPEPDDPCTIAR